MGVLSVASFQMSAFPLTAGRTPRHVLLILTGRKTWRGFAPYVGGVLGVAIGGTSPRDTSGHKFGTKITAPPNVGLRWDPARRLSIRGDVPPALWKLYYPTPLKPAEPLDRTPGPPRPAPP